MTSKNWTLHKLNQLKFVGRGKSRHRPRNAPELYGGPYPFVQTADIMNSEFYITEYSQTYSEAGLSQSKLWEPNTLCITNAGANTGESAILKFRACFPDSVIAFIADAGKSDVRFVKYYLDTIVQEIRAITRGATQDNLSLDKLLTFDIPTPPVCTQRKIASILSAYDDLIANNSRRVAILEEMAQAIYREWFVNFRFPGHETVKLVDSTLGQIPEGWEVVDLEQVVEIKRGQNITKKKAVDGGIPVVAGGLQPAYYHNQANTKNPVVTVSASGANSGYVNLYHEAIWASDCSFIDANASQNVYYFWLMFKDRQIEITGLQRGSAQPHVYPKDLLGLKTFNVPKQTLDAFHQRISPFCGSLRNLSKKTSASKRPVTCFFPS